MQSPCEPDVPQQVALVLALVDGIGSLPRIIKTIEVRGEVEEWVGGAVDQLHLSSRRKTKTIMNYQLKSEPVNKPDEISTESEDDGPLFSKSCLIS